MPRPAAAPMADVSARSPMQRELGLLICDGGRLARLPAAERLRGACRCALCVRARIDGVFPERFDGLAISGVAPIGHYAVNIAFPTATPRHLSLAPATGARQRIDYRPFR